MKQRKSTEGRSAFYRGISLRQYLRKNTEICKEIQYDDDSTIFLDQNHSPIVVSDTLIHRENTEDIYCFHETHIQKDISHQVPPQMNLPRISLKGRVQSRLKLLLSQRQSTDISQVASNDTKKNDTSLQKAAQIVEEVRSFKNGRSLCRKSHFIEHSSFAQDKTEPVQKREPQAKGKSLNHHRQDGKMKHQNEMKLRYNIPEKTNKKPLYLMRIKSHN